MKSVTLLSHQRTSEVAANLFEHLSEAGFLVNLIEYSNNYDAIVDIRELDDSSAIIALVIKPNRSLFLHLAYLLGRDRNIWILSDNTNILPKILTQVPLISLSGKESSSELVDQLRQYLNIDVPDHATISNPVLFLSWIRSEPKRISGLSPKDFERLVFLLLTQMGFRQQYGGSTDELILTTPDRKYRLFVDTLSYTAGQKIGIGSIERMVSKTASLSCDFSILVSANEFTHAAMSYAKSCAPAAWLLDRDAIEFYVRDKFLEASEAQSSSGELFPHLMKWRIKRLPSLDSSLADGAQLNYHLLNNRQNEGELRTGVNYWIESLKVHKTSRSRDCKVFLSCPMLDSQEGKSSRLTMELAGTLENLGIQLWHDSSQLNVGRHCRRLGEIASAVQRCQIILYIPSEDTQRSTRHLKILRTLASELSKSPKEITRVFVIGQDNIWSRLRLPYIFFESTFLNSSETDWPIVVLDACQSVLERSEKHSKNKQIQDSKE